MMTCFPDDADEPVFGGFCPCFGCGGDCEVTWGSVGMDNYGNPMEHRETCDVCGGTGSEFIDAPAIDLDEFEEIFTTGD